MSSVRLTRDQLKNLVIEYLKQEPRIQFENLVQFGIERRINRSLNGLESQDILEIIHEFIVSNILMTGMNRSNTGWPWLAVTAHGEEVLSKGGPPVYDYEGYLADLKKRVAHLDSVVERYLSESLRAYQANLYYSAMVMLGCSSERAIKYLIDTYINSIEDDTNREKLRSRISGRDISVAYDKFKESFNSTKHQLSGSVFINDFDIHVDGVFTFIRLLRNSIVHPASIPNITSALVYSNLQQFSYYIETVFKLIEYYQTNKTKV